MSRSFQILLIVLSTLMLQNCGSTLRGVDLDHARDISENVQGKEPRNGRYYGREMALAKTDIRNRTPKVDAQGRYAVLIRNRSSRNVKIVINKMSFSSNVRWYSAALQKRQTVKTSLPVGRYLAETWFQGRVIAQKEYEVTTAVEYDSETGEEYALVVEYQL